MTKLARFQTLSRGFVLLTSFPSITSSHCAFGEPELREVGSRGSAATAIILIKGKASRIFPQSAGRGSCLLMAMIPVLQFQALLSSLLSCSSKVVWRRNWSCGWAWCVCSNHLCLRSAKRGNQSGSTTNNCEVPPTINGFQQNWPTN